MDLDVLAVVKRDEAGVVKAGESTAVKVPAGCNAIELRNLIRKDDEGLNLLGYANRPFDVFTDASLSEGSLLSGLTPVPAAAAGAAAAAGGAGGTSSSTYTVVYLSLLGPREPPAAASAAAVAAAARGGGAAAVAADAAEAAAAAAATSAADAAAAAAAADASAAAAADAAAAAVGGAGSASSAGPFRSLPDGTMPPMFLVTLNSAVIGIYDRRTPVSTAVFFSPTRAITAHHDAKPNVGDILAGASNPHNAPVRQWKFTVVASSAKDDLVVLEIASGPPASIFLPLGPQRPIETIFMADVILASFGISAAKKAAENPKDVNVGTCAEKTGIAAIGTRHFVYHANTGRGDSGGAVINLAGQLVGVHLGGWNDSSPPPSPETAKGKGGGAKAGGAAGAAAAAAAALKNEGRVEAMGMAELGSATRKSIADLAKQLSGGGYGIYVCSPAVAALCSTVRSSSAGAAAAGAGTSAGGSGSLSGRKRRRSREEEENGQ